MKQLALTGAVLLSPFQLIEDAVLLIEGTKIKAMGHRDQIAIPKEFRELSLEGLLVTPGFIDQHLHGGGGADVMTGTKEALIEVARFHAAHGTTSFLATTMAGTRDQLVSVAKAYREVQTVEYKGAGCFGIHLEGPYLASRFAGMHSACNFRAASFEEVMTLQQLSGEGIKMITMAPEAPGVMDVSRNFQKAGIICSMGHSDADYAVAKEAARNGFSCVTHCFNEMRSFDPQEPGIVGMALSHHRLRVELILDGYHLHPNTVELAWKLKGSEKVILVSEAMAPAGLVDGVYPSSAGELTLSKGKITDGLGILAGSGITLDRAVKNLLEYTDCELPEAIRTVTYNPAKLLGINKRKGSLYPGKDADLIALTPDLEVVMTMIGGEIISGLITLD